MEDIAPELLKAVQAAFNLNMANESIAKKKVKIDSGEASYADAEEYAYDVGHALAEAMKECVSSDVLPDGRMYYNIAQKLLQPVLENNYNAMCDVVEKVQAHLNEEAGIGIKPIIPLLNQDRIDGLIKYASDAEHYDDVAESVSDGTTNFTQNVIDESIAANADFHYQAGMEPKIVRTAAGGDSCNMCLGLQGTYTYPTDKTLYMRHRECRCIVEYVPKDGKRQNVHSRQWKTDPELIEARKKVGLEEKSVKETLENKVNKLYNKGAISGAYNNSNDPEGKKREKHAEKYYEELRNSEKNYIVKAISKNTGISPEQVSKMYDHLLINEYDLEKGKSRFDPDYYIAESLQRLREGKNIQEHDLILIKHESMEYDLMNDVKLDYEEAHILTNKSYNYQKALDEWLDEKER